MFSRTVDVLNTHCKDKLFQFYLKSVANTGFRKITFTSKICAMFCRWLFVLLSSFVWSLCCLSSFDLRSLITPLVSSIFLWPHQHSCKVNWYNLWINTKIWAIY
jgi:hypothetical protein